MSIVLASSWIALCLSGKRFKEAFRLGTGCPRRLVCPDIQQTRCLAKETDPQHRSAAVRLLKNCMRLMVWDFEPL